MLACVASVLHTGWSWVLDQPQGVCQRRTPSSPTTDTKDMRPSANVCSFAPRPAETDLVAALLHRPPRHRHRHRHGHRDQQVPPPTSPPSSRTHRPVRRHRSHLSASTTMATVPEPVYFELSWSILSTVGAANVFFGAFVVSITNFSPIAAVPLVTSTAAAVANGLCYYAFYSASRPVTGQAVASAFADILWLVSTCNPGVVFCLREQD